MAVSIQKTTKADQKIALKSIEILEKSTAEALEGKVKEVKLIFQESDEVIAIPLKALNLLKSILLNMAEGKSIALLPTDAEISTQQAAELLNVSRPHIIKLLEKGEIPFKKVGTHRRILLQDLLAFEAKFRRKRRKTLDALASEAQKINLGYP